LSEKYCHLTLKTFTKPSFIKAITFLETEHSNEYVRELQEVVALLNTSNHL